VILLLAILFLQEFFSLSSLLFGLARHPAVTVAVPYLVITALVIVHGQGKTGAKFSEIFQFLPVSLSVLFVLLLTVFGLHILATDFSKLVLLIIPPPRIMTRILRSAELRRTALGWESFFAVALAGPIAEEIIFRGLILYGFLKRYGVKKAIGASTLLFALAHGNPWQLPIAIGLGILCAWCFVKTHSLLPCLFAHIANNSLAFMHSAIFPKFLSSSPPVKGIVFHPFWMNASGVLLTIAGIYILKCFFKKI
jgi:hypothetical protein